MKSFKYLLFLIMIVIFTMTPLVLNAAGSCTVAQTGVGSEVTRVTWSCIGDASTGTFPTAIATSSSLRGWVYVVDTTPGATAPTSSSGFTLISSESNADVLGGNAATILGSTAGRTNPAFSGWTNGTLNPVITGNSVAGAVFTIRAWIWNQLR